MNIEYLKKTFGLDGRTAVVTGASSGIGRGIAEALADMGAHVALFGRSRERLLAAEEEIRRRGGSCESSIVDITDKAGVESTLRKFKDRHGHLDIFVANAGFNVRSELLETAQEDIDALINTDYKGTLHGVMEAGRLMREQKNGNIVIISSVNGISAMANLAVYSSIKYALEGITRALAASLGEYGVRVNSCAPGVVISGMNCHVYENEENRRSKLQSIPLGKLGKPSDIGSVVAAMVSDGFGFMTGTTVLVDGGELLRQKQKQ